MLEEKNISADLTNKQFWFLLTAFPFLSLVTFVFFYLANVQELGLAILALIIAIPVVVLMYHKPKIWLFVIAGSSFIFFRSSDIDVTIDDVAFGMLYVGFIYIWLLWHVLVLRKKLVQNIADAIILIFYAGMLLNLIVATLNDVPFLNWFREYALFSNILLYFPIREYLKDKKDIKIFLILFGISVVFSAIDQFRMYKEIALSQTLYTYQLALSVRLNQTLFSATIFFSLILSLLKMKLISRILLWGLAGASTAALIVSFSRSFWIIIMFGVLLMLFYLNLKHRKILLTGLAFITVSGIIAFFSIFQEKSTAMIEILVDRLQSTGKGKSDVSVQLRLIEYEEALKGIRANPWFGNGMGKKINYYEPNLHFNVTTHNIHSGYLFAAYRFGIPMSLLFFFMIAYYLFFAERLSVKSKDNFFKALALSSAMSLIMIIVASFASNQFFARDGGVLLAVCFAFINIAKEKFKSENIF